MPKIRFTIRSLLVATVLFALFAAAWINPPRNMVRIKLDRGGNLTVNGDPVEIADLPSLLRGKRRWLSIWHREPYAIIECYHEYVLNNDPDGLFLPLVASVKSAGFSNPTIHMVDRKDFE